MSLSTRRTTDPSKPLSNLSLQNPTPPKSTKKKPAAVAESWDDESSGEDTETEGITPGLATGVSTGSSAPPPTPLTPTRGQDWESPYAISSEGPLTPMRGQFRPDGESAKRPEKTTATAARMIAAGLGVRPPKKTEEMKAYEKAAREKEERRLREGREERQKVEDAKRAAWED